MPKCPHCGAEKPKVEKEKDYFPGSRAYGFAKDPHDPRLSVKNYEEIATIDTICQRHKAGDSLNAIRKWLDGIGVKNRSGNQWHIQQIKRILERAGLL